MKTALQLYSVRDEVEKDFEGTLKAVSEFGYDGVEFAGLYGKTPEAGEVTARSQPSKAELMIGVKS